MLSVMKVCVRGDGVEGVGGASSAVQGEVLVVLTLL